MASTTSPTRGYFQRWIRVALAGYLVVGAFAAGYLITSAKNPSNSTFAIVVGALIAGPLAFAFVWHRLKTVKALGVEVSLENVTVRIDSALAEALSATQYFSGKQDLLQHISAAVQKPNLQLIEINLRSEPYWWSTRLYLQAALLDDHAQVQRLVFVEGDSNRRYVGMAKPIDVRHALAGRKPALERRYQDIIAESTGAVSPEGAGDPVQASIYSWSGGLIDNEPEDQFKEFITADSLRSILGARLESVSVSHTGPESPLLHYRILERATQFVPIVVDGRLERVIDATALARRLSIAALEHLLAT